MLFNVFSGPTGGFDSNSNDISLSSGIHSMRGAVYFFFSMVFHFFTTKDTKFFHEVLKAL